MGRLGSHSQKGNCLLAKGGNAMGLGNGNFFDIVRPLDSLMGSMFLEVMLQG